MRKYIDAEKLKAEINRLEYYAELGKDEAQGISSLTYNIHLAEELICLKLLDFIDAIQEQPVGVPEDEAINYCFGKGFKADKESEKQKEQNGKVEEYTDFTIYHPLKNGKGEYECIPYSFYGSLTSFSEDKDLIDFLRTCFYTEEECNEWIERQKEQKSRIDACGFPLRDEGESACSYLERCLAPDMRNIWYEACSEIKEKQQEQKLVDDNQIFLKGLMRVRDDKTLTEWEKQFDNIADKYAHNKNKEGYKQSWYTKERAAEMLHFAKKELEQSTECIKTEELPKHIKAEFESFRNLLKKKGIDYQPAETYWTDFARLFVSSAKKLQKPAEWSEEDEDMLNSCISSIEEAKENRYAYKETDGDTSYDYEIAWLKSLRPSWKPSEEQEEPEYYQHFDPDC